MNLPKQKLLIYIFIIFISAIALWPFFKHDFYHSHDGEWMVIRFTAFHQTLAGGNFPVRFVDRLNNNFGYPVLNFLYPLPFYLTEIPKLAGFGFVDSVKITFVASTIFSTIAMYWALSLAFSASASFAGSVVYLFIPYRFVDLYVRGSIGENLAFAILPLILGALFKIEKGKIIYLPLLSIFISLLIMSHNVIAAVFLPTFFLLALLMPKRKFKELSVAFTLGILIATFFWLPALYDLKYVKLSQINISDINDHLVPITRLIAPSWGYGPKPQGDGSFSPQIGLMALAVIIGTLYLRLKFKGRNLSVDYLLTATAFAAFLMIGSSSFVWQTFPFISIIQFPWRLLSVIVFSSAIFAAFVVDSNKKKIIVSALIILGSISSTILYTKPVNYTDKQDPYYFTNEGTTTVRDEYLPFWIKEKLPPRPDQKVEIVSGLAKIENLVIRPNKYKLTIKSQEETLVRVNTIYYPGWRVVANNNTVKIDYNNPHGLIFFKLPKGVHNVIIQYARTPVHLASEVVSLIALVLTSLYLIILKWRKLNF